MGVGVSIWIHASFLTHIIQVHTKTKCEQINSHASDQQQQQQQANQQHNNGAKTRLVN